MKRDCSGPLVLVGFRQRSGCFAADQFPELFYHLLVIQALPTFLVRWSEVCNLQLRWQSRKAVRCYPDRGFRNVANGKATNPSHFPSQLALHNGRAVCFLSILKSLESGKEMNQQTQSSLQKLCCLLSCQTVILGYSFSLFLSTSYFDKENHYKCSETIFDKISIFSVCRQIALFWCSSSFSLVVNCENSSTLLVTTLHALLAPCAREAVRGTSLTGKKSWNSMEIPEESKCDKFMASLSRLQGYCMPGNVNSHPGPNNTWYRTQRIHISQCGKFCYLGRAVIEELINNSRCTYIIIFKYLALNHHCKYHIILIKTWVLCSVTQQNLGTNNLSIVFIRKSLWNRTVNGEVSGTCF